VLVQETWKWVRISVGDRYFPTNPVEEKKMAGSIAKTTLTTPCTNQTWRNCARWRNGMEHAFFFAKQEQKKSIKGWGGRVNFPPEQKIVVGDKCFYIGGWQRTEGLRQGDNFWHFGNFLQVPFEEKWFKRHTLHENFFPSVVNYHLLCPWRETSMLRIWPTCVRHPCRLKMSHVLCLKNTKIATFDAHKFDPPINLVGAGFKI